jgi:hypothetical protein
MDKTTILDDLLKELAKAKEIVRVGNAEDVIRVKNLVGAMGQSFTTTVFAFQQASTVKSDILFVTGLAIRYREPWVAIVASEILRSHVKTLHTRYALKDTAALTTKAADVVATLDSEQIITLLRSLQEYYVFLIRRIRDFLPFYELSIAYEGYRFMTEKAVSPGREKSRERS